MAREPYILCIETSQGICSVAISQGNTLLYEAVESEKNRTADRLSSLIEEAMSQSNTNYDVLSAVAVSGGPGSYTGLRIGVSTAKGIAYALRIPILHIETFKAMQQAFTAQNNFPYDYYIPLIDARRKDAFTAVLDSKGNYLLQPQCLTIEADTFTKWANSKIAFFGQEIERFKDWIQAPQSDFSNQVALQAHSMIVLAYAKYQNKAFEDTAYYEPHYYKSFYSKIKEI